jgi:hypothetical protein
MRRILLLILVVLSLASCRNRKSIPKDVLPKQKMQAVLFDLMRADQFITDFIINKDSSFKLDEESIKLYGKVFALHHITKEEFSRSFKYYNDHPVLLRAILDSIGSTPTPATGVIVKPDTITEKPVIKDPPVRIPDSLRKRSRKELKVE